MMIYSGIFSSTRENHPVECVHQQLSGKPCPSCGMSRAFSELVTGNITTARAYNPYSIPVFLFFIIQMGLRLGLIIFLKKSELAIYQLVLADTIVSVGLFVGLFHEMFFATLEMFG
ncbi:MAG: DUF2752 domain-containing protein [Bacteroidota bacterium]